MKRLWLLMMLIAGLATMMVACGGGPSGGPGTSGGEEPAAEGEAGSETTADDASGSGGVDLADELSVYNWNDYIDEQVLKDYEEQYGVRIIYDTFASNEDLLAKLQAGASGYDVIFPSDYMVSTMIDLGLLAEIDTADLPNFANIGEEFKNPPYDPGNAHCVPYQWGMSGIAYRAGFPGFEEPPSSWSFLFDPAVMEQFAADGINVLNDQRELIGAALFYLGYPPNSTDRAQLEEARDLILRAKPFWKTFNSEDYYSTLMVSDEVALSHAWSGDAAQAYWETYDDATEDGNWYFTVPQEGAFRYQDNVCIPANSERYATALHFMNYLMDPEVAAAITNYTFYPSPNVAAEEFIDPAILNNPGIYPPPEIREKLQWIEDIGDAVFVYDEMWTAIKGQ